MPPVAQSANLFIEAPDVSLVTTAPHAELDENRADTQREPHPGNERRPRWHGLRRFLIFVVRFAINRPRRAHPEALLDERQAEFLSADLSLEVLVVLVRAFDEAFKQRGHLIEALFESGAAVGLPMHPAVNREGDLKDHPDDDE